MYIKSIDEAIRKAIEESGAFKGKEVEHIVKEAYEKASQRISIKMPVTISTPDEPWIYISSTLTCDRNFELFVIVNLTDVSEDYLKAKVFQGIFYAGKPRPAMSLYEKSIMIKAEDFESYVGPAAVKNFANDLMESDVLKTVEFENVFNSVKDSMTKVLPPAMPEASISFVDGVAKKTTASTMSVFEAPTFSRSFSLNSPPGIVELILNSKSEQAARRFNESIDRQLMWEVDGDIGEIEAIKAVSKSFGGLFARPGEMITRTGYNKAAMLSEGKSYALAHVREVIKNEQMNALVSSNPLWGSW